MTHAETVRIQLTSTVGPACNLELHPVAPATTGRITGSQNLGAFNGTTPQVATYQLTAVNHCNATAPVTATVTVRMRRTPAVRIAAVEVVQAIQTPANSVPLVARKRTVVRVSVDSGLTDSFNYGAGPNTLPGVTGTLDAPKRAEPRGLRGVAQSRRRRHGEAGAADQSCYVDRHAQLRAARRRADGVTHGGRARMGEGFHGRQWRRLVRHQRGDGRQLPAAPQPGRGPGPDRRPPRTSWRRRRRRFDASLQGARTRYPIAEDGFVIRVAPGNEVITTTRDLTNNDGWSDLLEDLDDLADDYEDHLQFIWAGLVPNDPTYSPQRKANSINERWWPLEDDDKRMLMRTGSRARSRTRWATRSDWGTRVAVSPVARGRTRGCRAGARRTSAWMSQPTPSSPQVAGRS